MATMRSFSLLLTVLCTLGAYSYGLQHQVYARQRMLAPSITCLSNKKDLPFAHHPKNNYNEASIRRHASIHSLNLGKSVLPTQSPLLQAAGLVALTLVAFWRLVESEAMQEVVIEIEDWAQKRRQHTLAGMEAMKELLLRGRRALDFVWERFATLLFGESDIMEDPKAWRPCTFDAVQDINAKYRKYTFSVNDKDKTSLQLAPAQKVFLCAATEAGGFVKSSYFGRRVSGAEGRFEVFAPRHYPSQQPRSVSPLHQLQSPGDVLAVRGGELTLAYRGTEEIRSLQLVCGGLGVVPLLSLLQRVFNPNPDLEIERCNLLWINDSKDDFLMLDEVCQLEQRAQDRFSCVRIMDADILVEERALNPNVRDEMAVYAPGSVAIVAAPPAIANKFLAALEELQYPPANVVYIPV